ATGSRQPPRACALPPRVKPVAKVRSAREQSVFRAVGQFVLTGLLAVLLLGLIGVQVLRSTGTRAAVDDAKRLSRVAGDAVVVPLLTRGVLDGDPRALARLDRAVRQRLLGRSIVR